MHMRVGYYIIMLKILRTENKGNIQLNESKYIAEI